MDYNVYDGRVRPDTGEDGQGAASGSYPSSEPNAAPPSGASATAAADSASAAGAYTVTPVSRAGAAGAGTGSAAGTSGSSGYNAGSTGYSPGASGYSSGNTGYSSGSSGYNAANTGYQAGNTAYQSRAYGSSAPGSGASGGGRTTPVNGAYHYSYTPAAQNQGASGGRVPPVTPPTPPQRSKPRRSGGTPGWAKLIAILLVCLLVGGGAGAGGAYLVYSSLNASAATDGGMTSGADSDSTAPDTGDAEQSESDSGADVQMSDREPSSGSTLAASEGTMSTAEIYDTYSNSVVSIEVQTPEGVGAGTGFVISDDGYILTCYHVVEDYQAISCIFIDSTSYEAAYIGGDKDSDLAVLKIEPSGELTPCVIGDSSQLQVGDDVVAIGNALGTFANTTTTGSVSGLDRALTMSDGSVLNVLQTDCTVNSGNSGGPLFNAYGEVIGVVNAKYSSSGYSGNTATIEGIGFAIPINDAMSILDDLINHGYITGKPYLGISVSTVSSVTAQYYANMVVGAYVRSVESGSCAETAGIQAGDIITAVGDRDITTYEELIDAKNALRAGDQMTLTVFREGTYLTIVVTLDEEVPESAAADDAQQGGNNSQGGQYFDPYEYFGNYFGY